MNPLSLFIRHEGLGPLMKSTEDRFTRLLLETEPSHPALLNFVTHLAATDMPLLEHILSNSQLVSEQTAWTILLLREAYAAAAPGSSRNFLRRLARKAGLANRLPPTVSAGVGTLTASQTSAFKKLRAMAEVYFQQAGAPASPVKLRLTPLLVGSSGTGKSHLAHLLGNALGGVRVLTLTVGSWMVEGSRHDPSTLEVIRQTLEEEERLILFIDELDKFSAMDSGWALAQVTELFAVLDRQIPSSGAGKGAWNETLRARLREKVFIVAAGAWQTAWQTNPGQRAGFAPAPPTGLEAVEKIRRARLIPDELLFRFSSDWLVLEPYTRADFAAIAERLEIPAGVLDPVVAEVSGKNFRYVEDCVSAAVVAQQMTVNAARSAAQFIGHETME